jgi:hypothetical protein
MMTQQLIHFIYLCSVVLPTPVRQGFDLLVSFQQSSEDWHADFDTVIRLMV